MTTQLIVKKCSQNNDALQTWDIWLSETEIIW